MAPAIGDVPVQETPVLVIGSSMVGMTLSALLAKQGIRDCITIDKHAGTAIHPRAALFHPRTMQIYRELGLYEQMKQESYRHYDKHAGLYNVESLAATLKGGRVSTFMKDINEWIEDISPTSRLFLTQQMFEPLLRKHATDHGAELWFSMELIDFQQDDEGVTALLQHVSTGAKQLVRARYMIACDGNKSFVRNKLGIALKTHGLLSHSLTIYFESDLGKYVEGRYNGVIYVNNDMIRGFFRLDKTGREGFLVVNTYGKRGSDESRRPADGITNEKAGEMLRAAIGTDVEFEITLIAPWRAVCDVAERFVSGRILLAGDAAHTVPPQGGFGGNTGIQDAHNLAWKLALVLQEKAGAELVIGTYQDERWPIAKKTVDQVFERYIVRTDPELRTEDTEIEEEVPEPHLELGYRYHSRALTTKALDGITSNPRTAQAVPGSMAHHVLIITTSQEPEDAQPFPIADLLGSSFVLLCGHEANSWVRAGHNLNREESSWLPDLAMHQLQPGTNKSFYEKYVISPSGCVLIRPDGFVAWSESEKAIHGMGAMGMPDPEAVLKCVMKEILCLNSSNGQKYSQDTPSAASNRNVQIKETFATKLFQEIQALEDERVGLLAKVDEVDAKLKTLRRMSELQNEMVMLAMSLGCSPLTAPGTGSKVPQHGRRSPGDDDLRPG